MFLIIGFILLFILLFWFMYRSNKQEKEKKSVLILMLGAGLFSLLFTLLLAFFLLIMMGSTVVIDSLFTLNISTNQLIKIAISYVIYWLTLDTLFEKLCEYVLGKNYYARVMIALSRIVIFYIIGSLIGLTARINFTLSIGVALIFLIIDALYLLRKNKK